MFKRGDDFWIWAGGAALVGLAIWQGPTIAAGVVVGAGYVLNMAQRGNLLCNFWTKSAQGVVLEDPASVLLPQAEAVLGYTPDLDTFALAVMGRSEGVDGMEVRMHVALNDLAELQQQYGLGVYSSIAALMLHSKESAADGHFSEQYLGKRYATDRCAYELDYHLAEKVRQDHAAGVDPSGGAVKFVDKDSFGVQRGTEQVTYEDKVAEWAQQGLAPFNVAGASDNFVVFRRTA
jgi:hypothetical protein